MRKVYQAARKPLRVLRLVKRISFIALVLILTSSCVHQPYYIGINPENPQFERGMPFAPLDYFGHFISLPYDLLFWTIKYGNHKISPETEKAVADFLATNNLTDVKVRINQWAPHKEIARVFRNPHMAWPYKILFLPSTIIVSLIARPFSGLIVSDYFDPASNTINIFSDEVSIALHEAGHAKDFAQQKLKGTYLLARIAPGVNLFQENIASDEAIYYLETTGQYEQLLRAYKILYPAYSTYLISYISASPIALVGAVSIGHWVGRFKAREKKWEFEQSSKIHAESMQRRGSDEKYPRVD